MPLRHNRKGVWEYTAYKSDREGLWDMACSKLLLKSLGKANGR